MTDTHVPYGNQMREDLNQEVDPWIC
jgi:hypothetical protein